METDYTSLFGGAPQRQRADDLVAGWEKALAAVSTQHLLGPIDVELQGSWAVAECHVRAWHQAKGMADGDEWVVGGHYVFGLAPVGRGVEDHEDEARDAAAERKREPPPGGAGGSLAVFRP